MRKLLLTSTALVAATSIAGLAQAADISVTGAFEWRYVDQQSDITASNGDDFGTDNEVVISFTEKTDNNITLTGRYDIDADGAGDAGGVDESSLTIAGDFGTIRLGLDDGVEDAFGVDESDLIAEDAAYAPSSSSILTNSGATGNTDANKITYFLPPSIPNLSAGISFTDSGSNQSTATDRTTYGASYNVPFGSGNALFEYNAGTTENSTAGGVDTDHDNYGVTLTFGAWTGSISASTQENGTSDNEATGLAVRYNMGNGVILAASTLDSEDDQQVNAGQPESYNADMFEIGYTLVPGLTAHLTYVDYEYRVGGAAAASDDTGSATSVNIRAAF